MDEVANIYGWLMESLGDMAWTSHPHCADNQRVEMFHGSTHITSQKRITSAFATSRSILRIVVATMAFGMGVQVEDVDHIIHWGPAKRYVALTGRRLVGVHWTGGRAVHTCISFPDQ